VDIAEIRRKYRAMVAQQAARQQAGDSEEIA
jgi:hypothetical protein